MTSSPYCSPKLYIYIVGAYVKNAAVSGLFHVHMKLVILVRLVEFNVPFQHKYGYNRDDVILVQ